MKYFLLLSLFALSKAFPNPQDQSVSLDDVLDTAADSQRYGADQGDFDPDQIADVFGINPDDLVDDIFEKPYEIVEDKNEDLNNVPCTNNAPANITVDDQFKECSDYSTAGYRCVAYYGCENGEIITDGGNNLFDVRFGGLSDVVLDPDNSKCPGDLEMCCRLPDFVGLPVEELVEIKKPAEKCVVPAPIEKKDCLISGYKCVHSSECLDYSERPDGILIDYHCSSSQVCCENVVCEEFCTSEYAPICGNDGVTYSNNCLLKNARCSNSNLVKSYDGECKVACEQICTEEYSPVCGNDGVTYSNACYLKNAGCSNSNLAISYDGECEAECEQVCIDVYTPVCGNDGVTYSNDCYLKNAGCSNENLAISYDGECKAVPVTPEATTAKIVPSTNKAPIIDPEPCINYWDENFRCRTQEDCDIIWGTGDDSGAFDVRHDGINNNNLYCGEEESYDISALGKSSNGQVCCKIPVDFLDPNEKKPGSDPTVYQGYQPKCGQRNLDGIGVRIQNRDPKKAKTQFGEWPHMCAVLNKQDVAGVESFVFVSGASLLSPNIVLTSAQNIANVGEYNNLFVRCGEWDTQQNIEPIPHQDRDVEKVIFHPLFVPDKTLKNNFALLMIGADNYFVRDRHIDTICLPEVDFRSFETENCYATGWGKDKFGKRGNYQVILRQVKLDMVEQGECETKLRTTRLGKHFKLHESLTCAGGEEDIDTCTGDGGSPLVCPDVYGNYYQTGIVAGGIGCGQPGIPGVYSNVTFGLCFFDWAAKCHFGDDFNYGLEINQQSCGPRWAKKEYCSMKEELENLNYLIETTSDLRVKGKLFRQRRDLQPLIPKMEEAIQSCQYGPQDIDCDNIDYYPSNDPEYDDSINISEFGKRQDN